ncbi:hypothetical protein GE061_007817 [Apolygus lucorum]|uniref:PiggyBac transposable element-derived protein domain-containing protein n=1 Tax=Apolygus lucorum TaxID=248454 RepID=A0A8S9WPK7_APOLU|nr:hypothetical protein GE061_007817 [Apolygus lucorum]
MKVKQYWTLNELQDAMQDPDFLNQFEDEGGIDEEADHIDIVQLPPQTVDVVSDNEEVDEDDLLDDSPPKDVPGTLEIHTNVPLDSPDDSVVVDTESGPSSSNNEVPSPNQLPERLDSGKNSSPRTCPSTSRYKKNLKFKSSWKCKNPDFQKSFGRPENVQHRREGLCEQLKGKSAVELFELFFTEDVLLNIVKESVTYATQQNRHNYNFSVDCLRKFLGILLFTGYHHLPRERLYWSEDDDYCNDPHFINY